MCVIASSVNAISANPFSIEANHELPDRAILSVKKPPPTGQLWEITIITRIRAIIVVPVAASSTEPLPEPLDRTSRHEREKSGEISKKNRRGVIREKRVSCRDR